MGDSLMRAQHIARLVDKISRRRFLAGIAADKGSVVVILNKADFLAVRLMGYRKAGLARKLSGFRFSIPAKGISV